MKNLLDLGKRLSKSEQSSIFGGHNRTCGQCAIDLVVCKKGCFLPTCLPKCIETYVCCRETCS